MPTIAAGDPTDPQARALLRSSAALMEELFDTEDNHFLSPEELSAPDIHFFTARGDDDALLGTIALAEKDGYGEIKALFVDAEARGQGVARALVDKVEEKARDLGLTWLRLETGDQLFAAINLYRRAGFTACGPFGDYGENETSVFMEKHLA
ncbi:GNAT family N-acetyltransferase [Lutimaribacter sp. EGI FJ00015]|uniref:GNAT family N-acetyltransferase n=1 Tax=Lutimaribacter degradans TaxID=2945989 RepID=A0ACC5ZYB0_9RHOB|nr:GNAT family N-acetyltransferase [Lutimaribacter sp. EGI FJ00013]MCM2563085.1 GNAT family N-acetyltransferase [Lutimaribacter sp. EGI FJ00013]MCO0614264.1 GNAT family N-acetyltransferase [Lutimaribacter sp. EGI FJ00015]MCO0637074.1 GNAT family N-acetyltransferase [Lutimaribacter sp. EGI FJ00014]